MTTGFGSSPLFTSATAIWLVMAGAFELKRRMWYDGPFLTSAIELLLVKELYGQKIRNQNDILNDVSQRQNYRAEMPATFAVTAARDADTDRPTTAKNRAYASLAARVHAQTYLTLAVALRTWLSNWISTRFVRFTVETAHQNRKAHVRKCECRGRCSITSHKT